MGIEVKKLHKSFGTLPVLRGVNLKVGWGQRLLLVGPNGSGKSTLIKVLATLRRPTAGQALVAGMDVVTEAAVVRPLLGVLCHQTYLYGELTVRENLAFYGRMYGVQGSSRRIEEVLAWLALETWTDAQVRTLSRGTQQRVALARTLLHQPAVLLLDEPDTGLDQQALTALREVLETAAARGCAILLTSHNLERGLSLADRVAILARGRIAFEAAKGELHAGELERIYHRLTGAPR